MAMDRRQQKRKKREAKRRKERRIRFKVQQRREKVEFLYYHIREAYFSSDYDTALNMALKALKVDPHNDPIRELAINCASLLNKDQILYSLLLQSLEQGKLSEREDYLKLGRLALSHQAYELARDLFQKMLNSAVPLDRPFTKVQLKDIDRNLKMAESMIRMLPILNQPQIIKELKKPKLKKKEKVGRKEKITSIETPKPEEQEPVEEINLVPEITFAIDSEPVLTAINDHSFSDLSSLETTLQGYKLSFRASYEQLLCLPTLRNVESLWYQEETARKIMKNFRGRAILADEVGLGKTIEAGMILKEYILRGLVNSALILTPSNLVNQWQEELREKFGLYFITSNEPVFRQDPGHFWNNPFILVSIQTARTRHHFDAVIAHNYDMVIVDEAHHLKNRSTHNWKLVNSIQKTFLLLLTATPVQNNLEELFNLVTLLRPGHLKTRKAFMEEFVTRGNPTDPRNREKLRQLLKEVMLRNTRSVAVLRLPPRFATTISIKPSEAEEGFYLAISELVTELSENKSSTFTRLGLRRLLEAAGSSHFAALRILEKMGTGTKNEFGIRIRKLITLGKKIDVGTKTRRIMELLRAAPDQKIIFVNYIATLEYLQQVLGEQQVPYQVYQGSMSSVQKQEAMDAFKSGCPVLLATGTGGEGHNLQFCHTMINYDLPWNPMEIEQRIGRIHRIGQNREVQVYNFCASGSIEDHILYVLDRKINMFELVIGEIDMILGRLKEEQEFSDMVYDIWVQNRDQSSRKEAFNALASRLQRAEKAYEKSKELDEKLFQEDFGV